MHEPFVLWKKDPHLESKTPIYLLATKNLEIKKQTQYD